MKAGGGHFVRVKQLRGFVKSGNWLWRNCTLPAGVFYSEPPCREGTVLNETQSKCTFVTPSLFCFAFVFVRFFGKALANRFGPGTGPIWLDNLYCTGSESWIGDCPHLGWGVHNCVHGEDVSITCYRNPFVNGQL